MNTWLGAEVSAVEGVGPRIASSLEAAFGIVTVRDLLEHYPFRYRDIGEARPLAEATLGEPLTIVGTIERWDVIRPRRGRMVIAKARVRDEHGGVIEAPFFNQDWRSRAQPAGTRVAVSGTLERYRSQLQLKSPRLEVLDPADERSGPERFEPVYPATEKLPSWRIGRFVRAALERLEPIGEVLPDHLRRRHGLMELDTALRAMHAPRDLSQARAARDRLVYDELLCLQIGLQQRRWRLEADAVGIAQAPLDEGLAATFLERLPFAPTAAQRRALAELAADLARGKPMHRLLQGDVGAGKTLVAAWAMLVAVDHGRQAVLMAPTEVLAEQHFRTLSALLAPLGVNAVGGPRLELLTGTTAARKRRGLLAEVAVGDVALLIGTHALLEEQVRFDELGVVVVDEQHRFGVEHRARLRDKAGVGMDAEASDAVSGTSRLPDVLVMTATPIPRSLALTIYGDLDVTVLDELPPGRQPIATQVIASDSDRRARLYDFIRERVALGERVYVVCPLVEDSKALDVASAESMYQRLSEQVFSDLDVALVHGRLPSADRDAAMEAFRSGAAQVLVATTVIEVGVDVPEATIMVIEDADRFGISQLHQLRGRVGRGDQRSYCVLFSSDPEANPRLSAVAATGDGFALAERDLELRGEGSLFDTRQSGLPDLKIAKLIRDQAWVARTREDARELVADDFDLVGWPALRDEVVRRYGSQRLAALQAG